MSDWKRPLCHPGWDGRGAMVAGQAHVRFDRAAMVAGRSTLEVSDLTTADRMRLTGLRSDLCGLTLDRPRIMGILNVTPDSFSDGGHHNDSASAVARAKAMAQDADIIDIGGESTRPGADLVPVDEEIRRTAPVIAALRGAGLSLPISIDTRRAAVAAAALDAGADIVNDVSGLTFDPTLAALVAARDVPVCLMHMRGTPQTMQAAPRYGNVIAEVMEELAARITAACAAGIKRDRIIVDPGIGFAKDQGHNLSLIRGLSAFHDLGLPVLLGASRKRFIGTIGGADVASDRMAGSLAVAMIGVTQGAQILRVHDTKETAQALRLHLALSGPQVDKDEG